MSTEKITVPLGFDMTMIQCENEECKMKFILFGVLECTNIEMLMYGADQYQVMPQSDRVFCPYCGKKIKED